MTRRLLLPFVLVLLLVPANARAQDDGWWGYIERLSGPGGFWVFGYDYALLCGDKDQPLNTWKLCVAQEKENGGGLFRQQLMIRAAYGTTLGDGQRFEPPFPQNDTRGVKLWELGVGYKYRIHDALDIGVGASYLHLAGDDVTGGNRLVLTPATVSFAPFYAIARDSSLARAFRI